MFSQKAKETDAFSFVSNCPIFILFIIAQIVILILDFVEQDYYRAFFHFWLGFIFYVIYKDDLCAKGDLNLGMNQTLIVFAFIFFQYFLVNWALDINDSPNVEIRNEENNKEKEEEEKRKRQYEYLEQQLNRRKANNLEGEEIDVVINKDGNRIILKSDTTNLNRGDTVYLKDGEKRVIVGYSEGFVNNDPNNKELIIQVDKPFEKDYDKIFVRDEKTIEKIENKIYENKKQMEQLGLRENELNEMKEEYEDEVEILEAGKKKLKKPTEDKTVTMESYELSVKQFETNISLKKKNIERVERDLNNLEELRELILKENENNKKKIEEIKLEIKEAENKRERDETEGKEEGEPSDEGWMKNYSVFNTKDVSCANGLTGDYKPDIFSNKKEPEECANVCNNDENCLAFLYSSKKGTIDGVEYGPENPYCGTLDKCVKVDEKTEDFPEVTLAFKKLQNIVKKTDDYIFTKYNDKLNVDDRLNNSDVTWTNLESSISKSKELNLEDVKYVRKNDTNINFFDKKDEDYGTIDEENSWKLHPKSIGWLSVN